MTLVLSQVGKTFGPEVAFAGVSLTLDAGQLCLLGGEDGAVKTTLLECVAGLMDCDGTISVDGETVYIAGTPALIEDVSVWDHGLLAALEIGRADWEGRYAELLARFRMEDDDRAKTPFMLSRGMKQKLALALAFLRQPALLALDEPYSGLDALGRAAFLSLLGSYLAAGGTALVATWDEQELRELTPTVTLSLP